MPSLSEYMAQSNRGLNQSVFGPEYLSKAFNAANTGTADAIYTTTAADNVFTSTFGRKVWQSLNNQTRFFNAIPRTVFGNTVGWRVRTDRGTQRSRPITETGSLPDIDVSNLETISSLPKIVSTSFGASVKAMYTAQLEGGVGDVLALENENAQLDHIKELNQELLLPNSVGNIAVGSGATDANVTSGSDLRIGDTVMLVDAGASTALTPAITAISSNDITTGTLSGTPAALSGGAVVDGLSVQTRAGLTSIDDIVAVNNDATVGNAGIKRFAGAYDLTTADRTSGTFGAAATVKGNSGVGRDLSLNLLDDCIQSIRTNGGEPKLILMGHDQYFKLERLLNSQQRYMGQEEYQVGVGSEKTFPGTRTGLVLATYQGIPILPDADTTKSETTAGAKLGSNVYVLDTDYLEIAVAQPTQYIENRDYFAADALVVRGLLYTMAEFRAYRFDVQGAILDLNS
jgi:hypothetical protein|tara:strand:- start:113 stop:1486 length:1374 start_codon:yes stop_codon:yes gene_type:complete